MSTRRGRQGGSYNAGMELIIFTLVVSITCGGIGWWIASQTGRDTNEGFLLGMLLGPFGLLVALLLPRVPPVGHDEADNPGRVYDSRLRKWVDR